MFRGLLWIEPISPEHQAHIFPKICLELICHVSHQNTDSRVVWRENVENLGLFFAGRGGYFGITGGPAMRSIGVIFVTHFLTK